MMPEVASDSRQLAKLGREQAELTQVVETYTEYRKTSEALEEAKTLLHEEDKEMREMARMEIEELEPKQEELLQKLEVLLIPKDPNDSHNAFLELRGRGRRRRRQHLCRRSVPHVFQIRRVQRMARGDDRDG